MLVEYDTDDTPMGAVTRRATPHGDRYSRWNFDPSERDGRVYLEEECCSHPIHLNGPCTQGGAPVPVRVWHVPGLKLRRFSHHEAPKTAAGSGCVYVPVTTPDDYAALGMTRIDAPLAGDPFDDVTDIEGFATEHCDVCGVMSDENLCRHLYDGDDGVRGPGACGNLGTRSVPEGFKRVVRLLGCARSLRRQLRAAGRTESSLSVPTIGRVGVIDFTVGGRDFTSAADALDEQRETAGLREGLAWVMGLDDRTGRANELALAWLDLEVAAQDARRASDEPCYGVRRPRWDDDEWVVRRVPWAQALAALRALPPEERDPTEREHARIVRSVPRPQKVTTERRRSA